ncbi:hypothetical protein SAMN00808754_1467 [Thermanaeromonas toyohensis ToBE]|uniref:Uncharacterized protein n=1 Tax=Thermanaeromonas toyohensis ToBE TaxID=698762 RepID=A0A1W1VSQ8_9FIRM|nr:hypothetical protein [Thermanaeromonas toyohensis]SMB96366.1 hypothetical protein SAMN00808754_1467 [Thermanaeromonas toyohensis ToBE]
MAWIAAWVAGGMAAQFKGCLLGLLGAVVCAVAFPSTDDREGPTVFSAVHYAVAVLGTAWALAAVFGVSKVVVVSAAAYLATLFICEEIGIVLWETGLQLPWMKAPLRGLAIVTGLALRRRVPAKLWGLLVTVSTVAVALWTVESVLRWYGLIPPNLLIKGGL